MPRDKRCTERTRNAGEACRIEFKLEGEHLVNQMDILTKELGLVDHSLAAKLWLTFKLNCDIANNTVTNSEMNSGVNFIDRIAFSISDNLYKIIKNSRECNDILIPDDLSMSIEMLDFNKDHKSRICKAFRKRGLHTTSDLLALSIEDLHNIPTLGVVCVNSVINTLTQMGIKLPSKQKKT